jgi:Trehalose receptor
MLYLIRRTLAVSLYSAEINEESKRPLETFHCIPKGFWCAEGELSQSVKFFSVNQHSSAGEEVFGRNLQRFDCSFWHEIFLHNSKIGFERKYEKNVVINF